MDIIGSLLDRIQGLLSKGFLLGGFIPAFIFLILNAGLMYCSFPTMQVYTGYFIHLLERHLFWVGFLIILLTFITGVVIWSLNPWFRQFLEGRYFPQWLTKILEKKQTEILDRMRSKVSENVDDLKNFRKEIEERTLKNNLRDARTQGDQLDPVNPEGPSNELQATYTSLLLKKEDLELISFDEIFSFYSLLRSELIVKSANADSERKLDKIQMGFSTLLYYSANQHEKKRLKAITNLQMRFADDSARLGPTKLANLSEVHREYGLKRYRMDIEHFWVRLLKVIKQDADLLPILEESRTQLDYSVSMTFLTGITCLIWMTLTYFNSPDIIPFLSISLSGFLLTNLFYVMTVQNYRAFVETVRSAIDLHRFDLLRALHIALPKNSNEEKALWDRIYEGNDSNPVEYLHEQTVEPAKGLV